VQQTLSGQQSESFSHADAGAAQVGPASLAASGTATSRPASCVAQAAPVQASEPASGGAPAIDGCTVHAPAKTRATSMNVTHVALLEPRSLQAIEREYHARFVAEPR
jgi:hypothetical protein